MRAATGAAAVAALALIAAGSPTAPVGTAQTRLTAAELTLSGVATPVDQLTLLDVTTFASTDDDTSRNSKGVPFSSANVAPATLGDSYLVPPMSASSDGTTSQSIAAFDRSFGLVSAKLSAAQLEATAAADSARSAVSAVTAELGVLDDALGLVITQVPAETKVDATGALATNGIDLQGLQLQLGELLPVDVADLPLGTVLELATVLAGQLSVPGVDLDALRDALTGVETALGDLGRLSSDYAGAVQDVTTAAAAVSAAETTLASADTTLAAAQAALQELQDDLASLDVTTLSGLLTDYDTECPDATDIASLTGCLEALIAEAQAEVDAAQAAVDVAAAAVTAAQASLDAAVTVLTTVLDDLTTLAAGLDDLVQDLLDRLQDVIAQLLAVLEQLPQAGLLDIDPIAASISASASADRGTGHVRCDGGKVAVAGITVVSDIDGCATVRGAAGQLSSAVATLERVLQTLTGLDVPTPEVALFSEHTASNGTDGAYRTADASLNVLELRIPSVALDDVASGAVQALLDALSDASLSQLLSDLDGALGTDTSAVQGLTAELDAALAGAGTAVADALTAAGADESALQDLLAQVEALVGGVIPDGLATPGVDLVVDPSASAQFAPGSGAPAAPAAPADPASPAEPNTPGSGVPSAVPSLPHTGGGLAALGALVAAGAWALRRRR